MENEKNETEKEHECGKYLYYITKLGESIQIFYYTDPKCK